MDVVASAQGASQDAAWTMGEISGALFLHAVRTGDMKRIEELARLGVDVNPSDRYCRSSLHLAQTDEVAMALLRLGAEGNLIDFVYRTLLHYAAERGMTRTVKWLLAEVLPADMPDAYDRTPLNFATGAGQLNTTLALMDAPLIHPVIDEDARFQFVDAAAVQGYPMLNHSPVLHRPGKTMRDWQTSK